MKDYETPGATRYGAQMGRNRSPASPDCLPIDTDAKLRLYRVRLDSGGYDQGGAYWGHGLPLYCAEGPEGQVRYLRAESREDAKGKLPNARFYR